VDAEALLDGRSAEDAITREASGQTLWRHIMAAVGTSRRGASGWDHRLGAPL